MVHPTCSIEVREITGSVTVIYCTYVHYKRKKYTVRKRHTKKVRHRLALQAARAAAGLAHPVPRHPPRVVRSVAPGSARRWRATPMPLTRRRSSLAAAARRLRARRGPRARRRPAHCRPPRCWCGPRAHGEAPSDPRLADILAPPIRCRLQHRLAGELASLLLPRGIGVQSEDQLADLAHPLSAPALHAEDGHDARHARREQPQRIKGALADPHCASITVLATCGHS